jgi:hypothetical protein
MYIIIYSEFNNEQQMAHELQNRLILNGLMYNNIIIYSYNYNPYNLISLGNIRNYVARKSFHHLQIIFQMPIHKSALSDSSIVSKYVLKLMYLYIAVIIIYAVIEK